MAPDSQIVSWIHFNFFWLWKIQDTICNLHLSFCLIQRLKYLWNGWIASTFFIRSWCSPRGLSLLFPHLSDASLNLYRFKILLFWLPKAQFRFILRQPPADELPLLGKPFALPLQWTRLSSSFWISLDEAWIHDSKSASSFEIFFTNLLCQSRPIVNSVEAWTTERAVYSVTPAWDIQPLNPQQILRQFLAESYNCIFFFPSF